MNRSKRSMAGLQLRAGVLVVVAALGVAVALQGAGAAPIGDEVSRARFIPPPVPYGSHVDPVSSSRRSLRPSTPLPGSPWQALVHQYPSASPAAMLLLTDGTVIVQGLCSNLWYRLSPDATGNYLDGTWTQIASMSSSYGPLYYASAVLPDGRVIVEGGEYSISNCQTPTEGTGGAIYNPVTNTWTTVKPPTGWSLIGDAPSAVLANGTFMLGGIGGPIRSALFNEKKLSWSSTGTGKADAFSEEGLSLLGNTDVLTVDTENGDHAELYAPKTGTWSSAGSTPSALSSGEEIGPQLLTPSGIVAAFGATGAIAYYNPSAGSGTNPWSAGPSFPVVGGQQYSAADAPAAVLPDGDVLVASSPFNGTAWQLPTHYFDLHGSTITQVTDSPGAANEYSYDVRMLVLPTGQVLVNDAGTLELYTDSTAALAGTAPYGIALSTTQLAPGSTTAFSGKQLNGLTEASAYGDDYQDATNFPLVKVVNDASSAVTFARTSGMTSMSVTAGAPSSADFTLPPGTPLGPSELFVGANGNWSSPTAVTVGRQVVVAAVGANRSLDAYSLEPGATTWSESVVAGPGSALSQPVVTQTATATAIAVGGANHSLDVYWDSSGTWKLERPGGAGSTYSAPSMTSYDGTLLIVAEGPSGSIREYVQAPGTTTWHGSVVAGDGSAQSAPVVARTGGGIAVAVGAAGRTLDVYWNSSGTWKLEKLGRTNSTYSAPSMTAFLGTISVVAEGPSGSIRAYVQAPGAVTWHVSGVAGSGSALSQPAITETYGGTAVAVDAPGRSLRVYWNASGSWKLEKVGLTNTADSAPATTSFGTLFTVVQGPGGSLLSYVRPAGTTTWLESLVAGNGTTFSGPGIG